MKILLMLSLHICFLLGGGTYPIHVTDNGIGIVIVQKEENMLRCYGKNWVIISGKKGLLMINLPEDNNYKSSVKFEYHGKLKTYSAIWDIIYIETPGHITIYGDPIDIIYYPK